jgi:hypothetical protein
MQAHPSPLDAALPGVVRQLGYFVKDVDQAMAGWLAMGVGPFYILRGQVQKAVLHGRPVEVTLSIAFANSGDLKIELVQQLDENPSINAEFLTKGREGFSHLAWWADDFDAARTAAEASGRPIVWSGGGHGSARFFYLEAPTPAAADYFEVMELTPSTIGLGTLVREAAVNWDGTNPIRPLG